MSKFDKSMEDILDVTPIKESPKKENSVAIVKNKEEVIESRKSTIEKKLDIDLEKDYKEVRNNYREIIERGKDALDELIEVAKESQHPRAYEVVATMMKNISEVNEKFIGLQKQMREMNMKTQQQQGMINKTNIDKAIFIGSTSDLAKFIKDTTNDVIQSLPE